MGRMLKDLSGKSFRKRMRSLDDELRPAILGKCQRQGRLNLSKSNGKG